MSTGPKAFIVTEPNSISVEFGGTYVALSDLARSQGLSIPHVSRVLRGTREPSVNIMLKLSSALGMTLDDFVAAIQERKDHHNARDLAARKKYESTLITEKRKRTRARNMGKPYVPNAALGRVS